MKRVPDVIEPMRALPGITGLAQEVFLDILRAAEALKQDVEELLKIHGLTNAQYNALRILRGAGVEGLTCHEVIERMIARDSDVTRLLDRLEARGLVVRIRSKQDRRQVISYLTQAGLDLVEKLDDPVAELHVRELGYLGEDRLNELSATLRSVRTQTTAVRGTCPNG